MRRSFQAHGSFDAAARGGEDYARELVKTRGAELKSN